MRWDLAFEQRRGLAPPGLAEVVERKARPLPGCIGALPCMLGSAKVDLPSPPYVVPSSENGAWFWLMGMNCPLQSLRRVVEAHRWQDALVYAAAGVAGVGDGVAGLQPLRANLSYLVH
jgi:hypothetical protein